MITYLVDKEWTKRLLPQSNLLSRFFSRSSSEGNLTIDTKKVLVSDRGLKHQVFVESPPVVAGKIRSYINSFKQIKEAVRETYPSAKFYFKEVDELNMQLKL